MNLFVRFILIFFAISTFAQQRAIGTWKTYLPYGSANSVAQSDKRIYVGCSKSVFYLDKETQNLSTLDKTNLLSDYDVTKIAYSKSKKTLAITYVSSNIDLIINDEVSKNVSDLKNKITTSSKNINDIYSYADNFYVCSDLGISVLDIDRGEILNTYVVGDTGSVAKVYAVAIDGQFIYAATDQGLKSASLQATNLLDFHSWTNYNSTNGVPKKRFDFVGTLNGDVFAVCEDTVYKKNGNDWQVVFADPLYETVSLFEMDNELFISQWKKGDFLNRLVNLQTLNTIYLTNKNLKTKQTIKDENSIYWAADLWGSLIKMGSSLTNVGENIYPSSPPSESALKLQFKDNTLFVASGGLEPVGNNRYNRDGILYYKDNEWVNLRENNYSVLQDAVDMMDVVYNSSTNKAYYASFYNGLIEYDMSSKQINRYDETNSAIQRTSSADGVRARISAMVLDKSGNLWIYNSYVPKPLIVYTAFGQWASFDFPSISGRVREMIVDKNGKIWFTKTDGNLVVYDPGADVLSATDDKLVTLAKGENNGNLPGTDTWSVCEDLNGDIWVGTDAGIGTYYCTSNVISSNGTVGCDADKIKVERDGYIGYLFSTEVVTAIATDGANRKWIGSKNGVWLISEDGKKELLHFTIENSPLLSNNINDIAINHENGEVFLATENGIISYQGDATIGGEKKGKAFVFPNPVESSYSGPIAIKGLVQDAYVKITDVSGTLVYQGKANGGQMIWDGNGYNGTRVKSGVYIVYSATELGKERNVAKIVVEN